MQCWKHKQHVYVFPHCHNLLNNGEFTRCHGFISSSLRKRPISLVVLAEAGTHSSISILTTDLNSQITQCMCVRVSLCVDMTRWQAGACCKWLERQIFKEALEAK